jgi:hypothetical protein
MPADAVRVEARELGIPLRWGGAWDIDFTVSTEPTEDLDLVALYGARRRAAGLRVFIDVPHFELPKAFYPWSVPELRGRADSSQWKFTFRRASGASNTATHCSPGATGHASVQVPVVTTSPG